MGAGEREDVATREDDRTESMIGKSRAEKHHKTWNEIGGRPGIW